MKDNVSFDQQAKEIPIIGKVKIELFDTDTETSEVIHKNNYVNKNRLEAHALFAQYSPFPTGLPGVTGQYFSAIALTDNEKPIDEEKDSLVEGKVIGYGVHGYSSDALRGNYNAEESIVKAFYQKRVYDFPTSSGNGTFSSIYTLGSNLNQLSYGNDILSGSVKIDFTSVLYIATHAGKYYVYMQNPNRLLVTDSLKGEIVDSKYVIDTSDATAYDNLGMPSGVKLYGMTFKDGYVYFQHGERAIYRAPLNDLNATTKVTDIPSSLLTNFYGLAFSPKHRKFVMKKDKRTLQVFDENFNHLDTIVVDSDMDDTRAFFFSSTNPDIIRTGVHNFDFVNRKLFRGQDLLCEVTPAFSIHDEGMFVSTSNFFSRVLLDSPVTKNSTQTMKITYEINIEPINLTPTL